MSIEAAVDDLRRLPYEDIGFAKIDHHRMLRCGAPEVIYGAGKTADQLAKIAAEYNRAPCVPLCGFYLYHSGSHNVACVQEAYAYAVGDIHPGMITTAFELLEGFPGIFGIEEWFNELFTRFSAPLVFSSRIGFLQRSRVLEQNSTDIPCSILRINRAAETTLDK